MAAAAAAEQIPCPPTYRFRPTKRELVTFYLLPRARGQAPFPGVVIEDDAAGSTLPWDLFERHGVGSEDEAYFLVRATGAAARRPGARQDRGCDGGVGVWKAQSSHEKCLRVGGEKIKVHVCNLNLHMGKGKNGGSVGWVMHEYTIAAPPCPSPVKICHIAFSGHGRKRMRVPDGQQCQSVGATASALPCSDDAFGQSHLLDSTDLRCFPSAASEQVPTSTQQQDIVVPQLAQESSMPEAQQLSAGELEFWNSIGVDVQSKNSFEQEQPTGIQSNGTMVTGVQSSYVVPSNGATATGIQSSYLVPNNGVLATGIQSSWVVPNTSAMADDLDDFCRSLLAIVPTNCAAPDFGNMATGTLGGGCSLIC